MKNDLYIGCSLLCAVDLWTYHPRIRGEYCTCLIWLCLFHLSLFIARCYLVCVLCCLCNWPSGCWLAHSYKLELNWSINSSSNGDSIGRSIRLSYNMISDILLVCLNIELDQANIMFMVLYSARSDVAVLCELRVLWMTGLRVGAAI
jgi:hypothetical protein